MTATRPSPASVRADYMAGLEAQGLKAPQRFILARLWAGLASNFIFEAEVAIRDQYDDVEAQMEKDDDNRWYLILTGRPRHEPMTFGRAA